MQPEDDLALPALVNSRLWQLRYVSFEDPLNKSHLHFCMGTEEKEPSGHKIKQMNIVFSGKNNVCSMGSRQEKLEH